MSSRLVDEDRDFVMACQQHDAAGRTGWLGGSVVERQSLIGELSLVCTGPAADG